MVTWPSDLPQDVLRDGFTGGFKKTMIRSPMDSGSSKRRRRFTNAPEIYRMPMIMTSAQITSFKTFFNTTIAGGTIPFDMTNPVTSTLATWSFEKEPEDYFPVGHDHYLVVLELELKP